MNLILFVLGDQDPGKIGMAVEGKIIPDTTYYLVFTSANNTLGISGDTQNPYSRGNVFAKRVLALFYPLIIPSEPTPLALLGLGLIGLGLCANAGDRIYINM